MNFAQAVFRRLRWLFKVLIIGYHFRLDVKPATLFKYLRCNCICIAYLTVWSMYVLVVVNLFFLNSISCPVFLRCFAAADCSDRPWRRLMSATRTPLTPSRTKFCITQRTENNTTDVVIQQHSRKLLMMDTLMSKTCWVHEKWNKITSDIKLVFYSSNIHSFVSLHHRVLYM
jgi:hypothetical protein